jgi:hypothetical protein
MLARPKTLGLGGNQVQSKADMSCLTDPRLLGLELAKSNVCGLWSQPSSYDVGMTCLPDPKPLDLADYQV